MLLLLCEGLPPRLYNIISNTDFLFSLYLEHNTKTYHKKYLTYIKVIKLFWCFWKLIFIII